MEKPNLLTRIKMGSGVTFYFSDGTEREFSDEDMDKPSVGNRVNMICEEVFTMKKLSKEEVLRKLGEQGDK